MKEAKLPKCEHPAGRAGFLPMNVERFCSCRSRGG